MLELRTLCVLGQRYINWSTAVASKTYLSWSRTSKIIQPLPWVHRITHSVNCELCINNPNGWVQKMSSSDYMSHQAKFQVRSHSSLHHTTINWSSVAPNPRLAWHILNIENNNYKFNFEGFRINSGLNSTNLPSSKFVLPWPEVWGRHMALGISFWAYIPTLYNKGKLIPLSFGNNCYQFIGAYWKLEVQEQLWDFEGWKKEWISQGTWSVLDPWEMLAV